MRLEVERTAAMSGAEVIEARPSGGIEKRDGKKRLMAENLESLATKLTAGYFDELEKSWQQDCLDLMEWAEAMQIRDGESKAKAFFEGEIPQTADLGLASALSGSGEGSEGGEV